MFSFSPSLFFGVGFSFGVVFFCFSSANLVVAVKNVDPLCTELLISFQEITHSHKFTFISQKSDFNLILMKIFIISGISVGDVGEWLFIKSCKIGRSFTLSWSVFVINLSVAAYSKYAFCMKWMLEHSSLDGWFCFGFFILWIYSHSFLHWRPCQRVFNND